VPWPHPPLQHGKRLEENQAHHDGDDTTEALQQLLVDQHGIGDPSTAIVVEAKTTVNPSTNSAAAPAGRPVDGADGGWGGAD
jgi:hypothetical protein